MPVFSVWCAAQLSLRGCFSIAYYFERSCCNDKFRSMDSAGLPVATAHHIKVEHMPMEAVSPLHIPGPGPTVKADPLLPASPPHTPPGPRAVKAEHLPTASPQTTPPATTSKAPRPNSTPSARYAPYPTPQKKESRPTVGLQRPPLQKVGNDELLVCVDDAADKTVVVCHAGTFVLKDFIKMCGGYRYDMAARR